MLRIDVEQVGHYAEIIRNVALAVAAVVGLFFSPKLWAALRKGWRVTDGFFRNLSALPATLEETTRRVASLEGALHERGQTHEMLTVQLAEIVKKVDRIDHQVHPNGGKSLNDKVTSVVGALADVRADQHTMKNVLRVCWDSMSNVGVFYCEPDGSNTYTSSVYMKWVGALWSELEGFGWINYIHPEDRQMVVREWESCVEDERAFNMTYRIVRDGGVAFHVEVTAQPLRNQAGEVSMWVGFVRKLVPDFPAVERRSAT